MIPWRKKDHLASHFRSYVSSKLSWDDVIANLVFRPGTKHPSLRRQAIEGSTRSAFKDAAFLLAVELFERLGPKSGPLKNVDEEIVILECLLFASSFLCLSLNPDEDTYEIAASARHSLVDDYELMSLLNRDHLENASLSRFDLYDRAVKADDHQAYLNELFCRVVAYLANGEHFSRVSIRYEEPPDLASVPIMFDFSKFANDKLIKMVALITKREMEEELDGA